MVNANLHGSAWIRHFILGFPLVGNLSQRLTYHLARNVEDDSTLRPGNLFASSNARFDERALEDGGKNARALWGEDSEQQAKGWPTPPFPMRFPSSSSCVVDGRKLNIAFRIGAHQGKSSELSMALSARSPT